MTQLPPRTADAEIEIEDELEDEGAVTEKLVTIDVDEMSKNVLGDAGRAVNAVFERKAGEDDKISRVAEDRPLVIVNGVSESEDDDDDDEALTVEPSKELTLLLSPRPSATHTSCGRPSMETVRNTPGWPLAAIHPDPGSGDIDGKATDKDRDGKLTDKDRDGDTWDGSETDIEGTIPDNTAVGTVVEGASMPRSKATQINWRIPPLS